MKTVFLRVLEAEDKATDLLAAVRGEGGPNGRQRFELDPKVFASIPGQPLAYWLPARFLELYTTLPSFENREQCRETKCGLGTLDDFRFLRLEWEKNRTSARWKPYFSGGTFSPFYEDFWLVVNWGHSGAEVKAFVEAKVGSASRKVQGEGYYFMSGFVFPRRTRAFSPKCMPSGGIFSTGGQAGFMKIDDLTAGVGILSSSTNHTARCRRNKSAVRGRTSQEASVAARPERRGNATWSTYTSSVAPEARARHWHGGVTRFYAPDAPEGLIPRCRHPCGGVVGARSHR
jgi:hypothetical protein